MMLHMRQAVVAQGTASVINRYCSTFWNPKQSCGKRQGFCSMQCPAVTAIPGTVALLMRCSAFGDTLLWLLVAQEIL